VPAPKGNLNRVKGNARGLALAFWRRRALLPADRWVLGVVNGYLDRRAVDLGGEARVTAGQRAVLTTSAVAQGVVALILAESAKQGGLFTSGEHGLELTPAAKELPKFLARVQAAELALGLAPMAHPADADAFALIDATPAANSK
jgi:hypothetical protein